MKEEAVTDALLRQFLLGKVEDEERQRIESLFITDSVMNDRVLAAEQELMDDYLEDRLSTADKETFLSLYGDTEAQQRELGIAKSIQEWATNQPVTYASLISVWDRLRARLLNPTIVIPIAVTAVLLIVLVLVWVNSQRTDRNKQYYLAVQEQLAQLNTLSSLRELPAQMSPLTLKPAVVRSVDPQPELTISSNVHFAELRLLWMQQEDYTTYQALVLSLGDKQSYTVSNLVLENESGKVVRIRLPSGMLTRGNYQIELRGVAADSSKSPPEVYSFTVSE